MPKQHGSWAMIAVPWIVGLVIAADAGKLGVAKFLLGPAWLLGYLGFNAATLALKAAPRRRPNYRQALGTYALSAAVIGAAAVMAGGLGVLWWAPVGLALVGLVLWLTTHKRERSLLAGVMSVVAGAGVGVVTRFWSPAELAGASPAELAVLGVTTAYFVGTVLVVKTMIRERGARNYLIGSIGYHAVLLMTMVALVLAGWLAAPWLALGLLCLVRAIAEPRYAGRLKPLHIGLVEILLSSLVIVCLLA